MTAADVYSIKCVGHIYLILLSWRNGPTCFIDQEGPLHPPPPIPSHICSLCTRRVFEVQLVDFIVKTYYNKRDLGEARPIRCSRSTATRGLQDQRWEADLWPAGSGPSDPPPHPPTSRGGPWVTHIKESQRKSANQIGVSLDISQRGGGGHFLSWAKCGR